MTSGTPAAPKCLLPLMTLEEMDELGIPRETLVIGSAPGRKSATSPPNATPPTPPGPTITNPDSNAPKPEPPQK
jgi:hypothetical protein